MSTRIAIAVLHCALGQWALIIKRGVRIKGKLYVNTTLFVTPKITLVDFGNQLDKAVAAEGEAIGGGITETAVYYEETTKLFEMLSELVNYVNGLYKGKKVELLASGFDVVDEAVPQDIPSVPVVDRFVSGDEPNSVKIFIKRSQATPGIKKRGVTYIIDMTEDKSKEENFKTVLVCSSQYQLIVKGLTRGKEYFFRISARNSRGQSKYTEIFSFIAQ